MAKTFSTFSNAISEGRDHELEYRMICADGKILWIHNIVNINIFSVPTDKLRGFMIDITDRMTLFEELERNRKDLQISSERMATFIGNLPGIVFHMEYDADGNKQPLFLDGGLIQHFSDSHEIREHRDWQALANNILHNTDGSSLSYPHEQLLDSGRATMTYKVKSTDNGAIWLRVHESVIKRDAGKIVTTGVVLDVTGEMEAKEEADREREQIRRLENRLAESRRMAALGELAGGIAHDFNNMLGAILGYASFVTEDSPAGSPTHKHASRILSAAGRGRELVEQVLVLTGRTKISGDAVNVADLLAEVRDHCLVAHPEREWLSLTNIDPGITVIGDHPLLMQALANICINGREAYEGASGEVTIAAGLCGVDEADEAYRILATRDSQLSWVVDNTQNGSENWALTGALTASRNYAVVEISDRGAGMHAERMAQAFLPFFTSKDRARHRGLGLPVVQGVVLRHGGAVLVRSRPAHGTVVRVFLPTDKTDSC